MGVRLRGYSLFEENAPLDPPEKDEGSYPSTPHIDSFRIEELHALRNRVRCTWLRHGSLRIVTSINRALLREARVTVEWRQTACGRGIASLAALWKSELDLAVFFLVGFDRVAD